VPTEPTAAGFSFSPFFLSSLVAIVEPANLSGDGRRGEHLHAAVTCWSPRT